MLTGPTCRLLDRSSPASEAGASGHRGDDSAPAAVIWRRAVLQIDSCAPSDRDEDTERHRLNNPERAMGTLPPPRPRNAAPPQRPSQIAANLRNPPSCANRGSQPRGCAPRKKRNKRVLRAAPRRDTLLAQQSYGTPRRRCGPRAPQVPLHTQDRHPLSHSALACNGQGVPVMRASLSVPHLKLQIHQLSVRRS
ncbi:hypothetical protein PHLGIDRAFT_237205 [Phlebiopsis gigantea 11061_1 CR5-6]|uniref:Uncharacterized protein n=1 Tax=Phlebiopsis gigantea (strain 11061_1 CR5-6) TaxID=745531 RepID=A0A0C3NFK1_PHLG1|nr:hypothetical protein PHLGIDRAFT_237205 [Phlebiopsis gigantea 11061_1 CR5-6]